jgi:hypothetical protein
MRGGMLYIGFWWESQKERYQRENMIYRRTILK